MKPFWKILAVSLSGVVLSGCGGSGDDGFQFIAPSSLPDTGSADYTANLDIVLDEGPAQILTLNGSLDMTVNFLNDQVTGDVTSLTDANSAAYTGSLTLDGGNLNRNVPADQFVLLADLDGVLTRIGDNVTYTSAASIAGDFYGTNGAPTPEQVRGRIAGTFLRGDGGVFVTVVVDETASTFVASQ